MTEVSASRTPRRTRPLGDVKDDSSYLNVAHRDESNIARLSGSDLRVSSGHIGSPRVQSSSETRRVRDIPDGFRQAALINIVASVNDGCTDVGEEQLPTNEEPQQFGNTMAVLSNLVLSKDRTISIPKPQSFEDPPEKFSQKKPVFYKHSTDEVDKNNSDLRKRSVSLTQTRTSAGTEEKDTKKNRPKSESIKISVSLQQLDDEIEHSNDASKQWFASPAKVRIARSMTPRRRRLTSKLRKGDSRVSTTLSTCEAVDIMDTTESLQNRMKTPNTVSKEQSRERVQLLTEDLNLYRAKSLPALFPVKRKKELTQLNALTDKTKLISPFKRTSVRAYGGMPNAVLGKTIHVKDDAFSDVHVSSSKSQDQKYMDYLAAQDVENKAEKPTTSETREHFITLEGRSIPNPNPPSFHDRKINLSLSIKDLTKTRNNLIANQDKELWKDLDRHFDELQKKISVKVNQTENKANPAAGESNPTDIAGYGLVGKGFKSNLSSAKSRTERQCRSSKRVTFADGMEEEDVHSMDASSNGTLCEGRQASLVYTGQRKNISTIQTKTNPSTNRNSLSSEIVKLKKRIIPSFQSQSRPRYDLLDNVKISKLSHDNSGSIPLRPQSRISIISDASSFFDDMTVNGKETDYTDRECSSKAKSYGVSSFYPDQFIPKMRIGTYPANDSDSDDSDDDYNRMGDVMNGNYRVVKAVDLGTLSGFQHRKFRKPATAPETNTTHFVKIKLQ